MTAKTIKFEVQVDPFEVVFECTTSQQAEITRALLDELKEKDVFHFREVMGFAIELAGASLCQKLMNQENL